MPSILGLLTLLACLTPLAAEPALRTPSVNTYALLALRTHEGSVDLSFSPDGRTLLSTCREDPVLWEVASARQRAVLRPKDLQPVAGGRFLPGGRTVLLQRATTVAEPRTEVHTMPDGQSVVVSGTAAVLRSGYQICTLPDARLIKLLSLEQVPTYASTASPSGRLLAALCTDHRLIIWSLASGKETHKIDFPSFRTSGLKILQGVFSAEERYFAFSVPCNNPPEFRSKILLYDLEARTLRTVGDFKGDKVHQLALSADSRQLVTGGEFGTIQTISLSSGRQRLVRAGEGVDSYFATRISPDGSVVVLGRVWPEGSPLEVWDVRKGEPVCHLKCPEDGSLLCIALAGDLSFVAAAFERTGKDHVVALWKMPQTARAGMGSGPCPRPKPRARLGSAAADAPPEAASVAPTLERLWARLASDDPRDAYRACWSLLEQPEAAVALFRSHLRPAPVLPVGPIRARIAQLDDDDFRVREAAMQELRRLGDLAIPELRAALGASPGPEARRRVKSLLGQAEGPTHSRRLLREIRAVEVLEYIGTEQVQALLADLAVGCPSARLTREAAAALQRLDKVPPTRR